MYLRLILFGVLAYLIIRLVRQVFSGKGSKRDNTVNSNKGKDKRKVSKDVGEYVDYEDMD